MEEQLRAQEAAGGAAGMMEFLKSVLCKLESAQGCIDEEARQGLELLRQKTRELEAAQARAQAAPAVPAVPPTSLDIAGKIGQLQSDLSSLEGSLDRLDSTAKQLVAHSASLWLGDEERG